MMTHSWLSQIDKTIAFIQLFLIVLEIKYENLNASTKLSGVNDSCSFQHQDIMVLDKNIDQIGASADTPTQL